MNNDVQSTNGSFSITRFLWHNRIWLVAYVSILIAIILLLPGAGVIPAFGLALLVALICIGQGSFADLGLTPPNSWGRTILTGLAWGIGMGLFFLFIGDPLIEKITGETIDLSQFDSLRGNVSLYLLWLAIGWLVGGFIEEFTFRGTVISRLTAVLGRGPAAVAFAILVAVVPFGLAHLYQGMAGQISTGLNGLILAILYVKFGYNLWIPIFAHGFNNTVGLTVIFLDVDWSLGSVLFG